MTYTDMVRSFQFRFILRKMDPNGHTNPELARKRFLFNPKTMGDEKAIKITFYLGWSWVEWGGVSLARLQFWLQNAGFGLLRKDRVLVSH